ncbi:hypothetical protein [Anaerotruncus rubiinfantis]|uniref:hypothetical protein n=1 Tax=Anaerotruncus rubiinfantis TaxID=1720200 RepID=UPI001898CA5E|nr:hypothetical protein [Anaerotruncus rubiinfantis]
MKSTFIQIGVTAARDPETGDFLPAEPIFKEVTPELEKAEAATYNDVGKMFAEKMKHYIEGGGLIEKRGKRRAAQK